jgi:hypothetical protein
VKETDDVALGVLAVGDIANGKRGAEPGLFICFGNRSSEL